MKVEYTEKELRGVEEILTKPVFIGFSEETIRVRRNLLTIAFLTVFYNFSGIAITGFSFLGIIFSKIPDKEFLDTTIFLLLLYHLVRFVWQSWDAFQECKIRITGTNALFMKNDNDKENSYDFTTDYRQSSLLNWWWKQTRPNSIDISQAIKDLEVIENGGSPYANHATSLDLLAEKFNNLKVDIEALNNMANSKRTLVSLRRFENFYKYFSYSQISRWLVVEFGLPVILAIIAMYQTCQSRLVEYLNFPCL